MNISCLDLPTEGNNVISVSALGPSKTKADYSNWSYEETTRLGSRRLVRDEAGQRMPSRT